MDGLILAFKIYMFTWIFSPLSLLWCHWLSKSCYDIIDYQNQKHHSMYFVLTQRGRKYGYSITESGWNFSVFCSHDICMPFYFTIMAYDSPPYYSSYGMMVSFLACKVFLKVSICFILSSEIIVYLQWIKVIFSQVKWYSINSQVSDTIYVFTVAKIWKFLAQMHFKMFGKWETSWKWCYGHWSVLTFLPMMSLIARLNESDV